MLVAKSNISTGPVIKEIELVITKDETTEKLSIAPKDTSYSGIIYYTLNHDDPSTEQAEKFQYNDSLDFGDNIYAFRYALIENDSVIGWSSLHKENFKYYVGQELKVDDTDVVVFYVGDYEFEGKIYSAMATAKANYIIAEKRKGEWGSYWSKNVGMEDKGIGGGIKNSNSSLVSDANSSLYIPEDSTNQTIWAYLKSFRENDYVSEPKLWFIPSHDELKEIGNNVKILIEAGVYFVNPKNNNTSYTYYASSTGSSAVACYSLRFSFDISPSLWNIVGATKDANYYFLLCRALE